MHERKNTSHVTITLFPFLSVIACVIGTLTLLLSGLGVEQIANGETEERSREKDRMTAERAALEIEELEHLIADFEAREELLAGTGSPDGASLDGPAERLARLREEIAKVQEEIAILKARKDQASLEVIPMGGGQGLIPAFVECNQAGLVLDADGPEDRQRRVPRSSIVTSEELVDFFKEVGSKANWTVIFLVRRGGVKSYDLANEVITRQGVRHGCLAAPGTMKLNFEAYRTLKGDEARGKP